MSKQYFKPLTSRSGVSLDSPMDLEPLSNIDKPSANPLHVELPNDNFNAFKSSAPNHLLGKSPDYFAPRTKSDFPAFDDFSSTDEADASHSQLDEFKNARDVSWNDDEDMLFSNMKSSLL
ncbi:MAG: hypothetical protein EOP06_19815 [Proteobacteria bacterium]|nr:MAG: hypothetical protein EOP06_19815 [Pseudomonadota bacterium]